MPPVKLWATATCVVRWSCKWEYGHADAAYSIIQYRLYCKAGIRRSGVGIAPPPPMQGQWHQCRPLRPSCTCLQAAVLKACPKLLEKRWTGSRGHEPELLGPRPEATPSHTEDSCKHCAPRAAQAHSSIDPFWCQQPGEVHQGTVGDHVQHAVVLSWKSPVVLQSCEGTLITVRRQGAVRQFLVLSVMCMLLNLNRA